MKIQATQSIQLPLLGIVDTLEIRVNPFDLFPTQIEVVWKVSGDTLSKEGTLILPQDIVHTWGTDDTVVKDYVLQQLGLVEEVEPTPTEEEVIEEPIIETPEEEIVEPTPTEETPPTE